MVKFRFVTGDFEEQVRTRLDELFPRQAAAFFAELAKSRSVKRPQANHHPACTTQMQVAAVNVFQSAFDFDPAWFFTGLNQGVFFIS